MLNEMYQVLLDRADFRKSCCFYCKINLLGCSLLEEKYPWMFGRTPPDVMVTAEQLVQLLVILDGKGDVTGHDASLLVIVGGVTGKLQYLVARYSRTTAR